MTVIVPFKAIPNRRFSAKVPIDGSNVSLSFFLRYNELAKYWFVDIAKGKQTVCVGVPLIPAQNILEQYAYLGIGSAYIVPKHESKEQWPTLSTLENDWQVIWSDTHGR